MNYLDLISKPEGRKVEFKEKLPLNSDLAKTVVAFANDAGGEIFIGINNKGKIIGIKEEELQAIEEKISNLIYDRCYPAILPDISFINVCDKNIIYIQIHKGSTPPYYLKKEGKLKGTYIRVGSNNRQADSVLIEELERKKRNITFDSELIYEKTLEVLNIKTFKEIYKEKTGEELSFEALKKLDLIKSENSIFYPTNSLILFSDDEIKESIFPNAKIECARFKGYTSDIFIDKKTISGSIAQQAEDAYNFILRNINESAHVEGVYTIHRWEYPIKAIREIIRNAVVHRQYSLSGMDIKIAVYDDMVEISSPGLIPPSIDYSAMESRQSDARNKTIAKTFKKLGIIDQWGNGLKLVSEELKSYPEIKFSWRETGLTFQVQFSKVAEQISEGNEHYYYNANENKSELILSIISKHGDYNVNKISEVAKISKRTCERLMKELKDAGRIKKTGNNRIGKWIIINKG